MNYYDVSFSYPGSFANIPYDGSPADAAWQRGYKAVRAAIHGLDEVEWRFAYGWPDGSLYFFARTLLDPYELRSAVDAVLPDQHRVHRICACTADSDPHKLSTGPDDRVIEVKTLRQYFEKT